MTGIGCEHCTVGQCQGGKKIKQKKRVAEWRRVLCITFVERKISAETEGKYISAGNYANVNMTCDSAPCVMRREGNLPTLERSATDATISISKAHTSRPHWHPHPPPHSPNPKHHVSIFPSFLRLLTPLSLLVSLQRCYSNGEMWEYLRPSECRKGGGF